MGLMRDRKLEDEYARILDDMGLDLPEDIVIEEENDNNEKKEDDKRE